MAGKARTPTIILADPHRLVRTGLRLVLENAGLKVIAEADDGFQAVSMVQQQHPAILLTGLELPGLHGFEVLARLRDSATKIIIVSRLEDASTISECLRLGAMAYVLKSSTFNELQFAVRCVLESEIYLCTEATRILMRATREGLDAKASGLALTQRELIVMQLAATGKTSSEIATALFMSPRTAEAHRSHAMKKLHLHNQTELVHYGIKQKWVSP
jgi:DNA-binding NarL/FixJ family response regulator